MDANAERGYTIERTIPAPRQMVWDAWTTPERFATWWGTAAVTVQDTRMDVREGGEWSATMVLPDGHRIDWAGRYLEVSPPARLVLEFTDQPDVPEYDRFTVVLTESADDSTHMVLRQSGGHLSDEEYEQAKVGTASFVDAIEDLLRDEILKMRHDTGP